MNRFVRIRLLNYFVLQSNGELPTYCVRDNDHGGSSDDSAADVDVSSPQHHAHGLAVVDC